MKGKFAHISDCHIGAWRDPRLREINDNAFGNAIDLCVENEVDFVLISGDIFDVGIPEMSSVRSAVRKLRKLDQNDIATYVVYGSHDYSPTTVSVVDVLTSAGLFVNVGEFSTQEDGGSLELKSAVDEKTGVKISGLPARKAGLEAKYYRNIASNTENGGYSIFVFHASINELQSLSIPVEQSLTISELPKGFSYYAGGHIHKRSAGDLGGSPVVYPGPLFGTSYADLELTAKGEKRGFALVEFDENRTSKVDFIDIPMPKILSKTVGADGKSTEQLEDEIENFAHKEALDVEGSIVLLKVKGTLSSGRPSDIDWYRFRQAVLSRGAIVVNVNRAGLASQELRKLARLGTTDREEIESKLIKERTESFKAPSPELASLSSTEGSFRAKKLLKALKTEKREEETRPSFEKRVLSEASQILDFPLEIPAEMETSVNKEIRAMKNPKVNQSL